MVFDGLRRVFRLDVGPRDVAADVDREIEHHFAAAVEDLIRRGVEPGEAQRIAEQRFGDVRATRAALLALAAERAERQRRVALRADWWLDVRHALKAFTSAPGVTVAAVIILALGIGANAAMYGILSKLFIQPPPHITNADRIVRLYRRERSAFTGGRKLTLDGFDFDQYTALARGVPGFASLAGYGSSDVDIGRGQQSERVLGEGVTGDFFALLGTQPILGRFIEPGDDDPAAAPAAVISYGLWRRRFGGSHAGLGATIDVDRVTYTIIGVTPPGFSGPEVDAPDVWFPAQIAGPRSHSYNWRSQRYGGFVMGLLARPRPGVSRQVAAQQATRALQAFEQSTALPNETPDVQVLTGPFMLALGPTGAEGLRLPVVVGGVALILLVIACANVANLLALRAVSRRRELAVRTALGAGRWRVVRMLVIESVGLALAAGAAALAIATLTGRVLRLILLPHYHWVTGVVDLRVLLFAAAVALVLGFLTGLVPAVQAARGVGLDDLRAGVRAARRARTPVRAVLLLLQGALALVLVAGAGTFYASFAAARRHDPGFALQHLLVVNLNPIDRDDRRPPDEGRIAALSQRLRHLPGVVAVAETTTPTAMSWAMELLRVRGMDSMPPMRTPMSAPSIQGVTPEFFRTAGLSLVRGRALRDADGAGTAEVAVVNTAMARELWPNGNPLGACLYIGRKATECTTVVGVVETESPRARGDGAMPQYYVPLAQYPPRWNQRSLLVRTRGEPSRLIEGTLRAMADLFPDLPRERVTSLPDYYAPESRPWKVGMSLFGAAGTLALLLAGVGLYAVIAYGVRQREHEFGIRRALGARVGNLIRLVLAQSVAFAAFGMVVGAALAYWGARFVEPLLYPGLSARDPAVLLAAGAVLLTACLAAGFLPARSAGRADPRAALQAE